MRVILLDKISSLGVLGDQVNVKAGYARNFLIPKNKAVLANKKNIVHFEMYRAELEANLTQSLMIAKTRAEKVSVLGSVTILSKAGKKGKLFGSIGAKDIANAVTAAGVAVTKGEVRLPNGSIRNTGQHEIHFHFHNKVSTKLIVNIVSEPMKK